MIRREASHRERFADVATAASLPPLTPAKLSLEEFMRPMSLTAQAPAAQLGVKGNRISSIVNGSRPITAETASLLSRRFGTSAEPWMNLQKAHDLAVAREAFNEDAA